MALVALIMMPMALVALIMLPQTVFYVSPPDGIAENDCHSMQILPDPCVIFLISLV
jgi:hypothetical protein